VKAVTMPLPDSLVILPGITTLARMAFDPSNWDPA
jgi:hypothetical protein